ARLSHNPVLRLKDAWEHEDTQAGALPPQLPDPAPAGALSVQLLRTYPYRRSGYPFARQGERSIARGYRKAAARARRLIYLEDQYLWSTAVGGCFADALRNNRELRLIAVVPRYPDQQGKLGSTAELFGRASVLAMLADAGGERVAVYSPENDAGVPVYVHAKVCVMDDRWATVGSDNVSMRSWTHDSELTCAVFDPTSRYPRDLRIRLGREHLGLPSDAALRDPDAAFDAFATSAAELAAWHADGRRGPRPPGRLLPYRPPQLSPWTRRWSRVLYRVVDPDGRPRALRRAATF
ncbi:MAG TPA: phospholipase D-like domain-containing protein, partial [Kribbellaceae bacterium]